MRGVWGTQAGVAEAAAVGPDVVRLVDYVGDTWASAGSLDAIKASAGMVNEAVTAVFTDPNLKLAYCATRPPGTPLTGR